MKNLHFHVLFIDGVFSPKRNGDLRFHKAAPSVYFPPRTIDARLTLTDQGMVRCALKTAHRDGTTHVVFERGGRPSAIGFYGQTGSIGAKATNQPVGAAFMPLGAGIDVSIPRRAPSLQCLWWLSAM